MVQSVRLSITVVVFSIAVVVLGQLDHFLPPPPARFSDNFRDPVEQIRDQLRPSSALRGELALQRNPYLSKVYGGNWFRSNFQDLFSYKGAQKLEWFEVLEGNDCSPVPATVNAGRPPRDICLDADSEERRCICVNTGRDSSSTGYERICGTCRNPCLFNFTPDKVPKYVQKLAVIDDKDYDYNDKALGSKRADDNEYDYTGDYADDYYYDDRRK